MTATTMTKVQQATEVGEGLAVGCLLVGVSAVTTHEGPLEVAFSRALAGWPWAARYASLTRSKSPCLGPIIRLSPGRRRSHVAQWIRSAGVYVPQLRDDDWDLGAASEGIEEGTTIPIRQWCALATSFVDGLENHLVWRSPPPAPETADAGTLWTSSNGRARDTSP